VRNEWVDVIEALRYTPPGYGTVLEGAVKGHLSEDEARRLVDEGGIDPKHYDWMYAATGNPPGAGEMLDLWNRGEITQERVIQALRQGHLANEYIPDVLKLKRELLPAGECVLMVESGTWTKEKAVRYLMMHGYSPEDAADYATAGSRAKIRDDWTLGKQIVQAQYQLGVISHADAVAALQPLGYEADEAEMIIEVAKLQRIVSQQSAAVDKVRSLYTGHSIDAAAARGALAAMHVPAEEIDDILRLWTLEREANVKHLTESEIVSAFKTDLLDQAGAQARLEQIGYTPEDAWVLLSIAAKGPLPNRPSGIVPATPQAAV
jgi:SOS response regulatory protein OraA/RecX